MNEIESSADMMNSDYPTTQFSNTMPEVAEDDYYSLTDKEIAELKEKGYTIIE